MAKDHPFLIISVNILKTVLNLPCFGVDKTIPESSPRFEFKVEHSVLITLFHAGKTV